MASREIPTRNGGFNEFSWEIPTINGGFNEFFHGKYMETYRTNQRNDGTRSSVSIKKNAVSGVSPMFPMFREIQMGL
jgi:hypothetical protein